MSTSSLRIVLLVLCTLAFAAVWSNDHGPQTSDPAQLAGNGPAGSQAAEQELTWQAVEQVLPATIAAEEPSLEPSLQFPHTASFTVGDAAQDDAPQTVAVSDSSGWYSLVTVHLEQVRQEVVQVDEWPFPLPKRMRPGIYRVIDRRGNVVELKLTRRLMDELQVLDDESGEESYVIHEDEQRWHFIPVEPDASTRTRPIASLPQAPAPTAEQISSAWKKVIGATWEGIEQPMGRALRPVNRWLDGPVDVADEFRRFE